MSIQAVGAVIELRGVPPVTKLVLTLLANAYNGHTHQCNPDQARLADECGISARSIRDHLNWLEEHGYIARKVTELGRGEGKRTDFDLLFLHRQNLPEHSFAPEAEGECSGSTAPLLRKPASGAYKDKPEENRNEPETAPGRGTVGWTVEELWKAGPQSTRAKSSRKELTSAVTTVLKKRADVTGPALVHAYGRYLKTSNPDRDGGKYALGVHRWISQHRFDAFIGEPGLLAAAQPGAKEAEQRARFERLDTAFWRYSRTGEWHGAREGWPMKPDQAPPGHYPEALYAKHKLKPLAPPVQDAGEAAA